jgi:N-methylhydantoinase B
MVEVKTDEILGKLSGGGGGVGDPAERDPEKVLTDVVNEYITVEMARETYRVVIDLETRSIDWEQTQALRQ